MHTLDTGFRHDFGPRGFHCKDVILSFPHSKSGITHSLGLTQPAFFLVPGPFSFPLCFFSGCGKRVAASEGLHKEKDCGNSARKSASGI